MHKSLILKSQFKTSVIKHPASNHSASVADRSSTSYSCSCQQIHERITDVSRCLSRVWLNVLLPNCRVTSRTMAELLN